MTTHSVSLLTTMYRQLTEQAERYLRSLYQQDDIAGELKRKLADLMARGEANADAACRALKLSRRTLQRRLKAEKTSFQTILKEVRAELAVNYLKDARLRSLEIAMLLGYSNISSFTTAFKSWYDLPPAEYRQKFLALR
ncbi:MAG: helix-turn-helix domain-containing protein [Gammaproteobacteria bacterium]|nr:helix-turn-helix domain-containing protein [Gammaproteobacteria bacterium]